MAFLPGSARRSEGAGPTPRHTPDQDAVIEPANTTLGQYLTFLRQREERRRHEIGTLSRTRKLSRERTAAEAHITASYLTKVERDEIGQVAAGILRQLAETYHADEDEWRYVCDLAGHAAPYPPVPGMDLSMEMPSLAEFEKALTPLMHTEMSEAVSDLVSFYTPERRLIAANHAYLATFPSHRPGTHMLEWSFTDEAKAILVDWEEQADLGVAWHRGIMGRFGHTVWARESHRRLWAFAEFRRIWRGHRVAYVRPAEAETLIQVGGDRYHLSIESWQMQHRSLPVLRSRARLHPVIDHADSRAGERRGSRSLGEEVPHAGGPVGGGEQLGEQGGL